MANYDDVVAFEPPDVTLLLHRGDIDEARLVQFGLLEGADNVFDVSPPTVTNFDPEPGSPIALNAAITFDVLDDVGLRVAVVLVRYNNTPLYEVAWDGAAFAALYSSSTRTAIADGYRFTLARTGGWPATPTIRVLAVDVGGNEDIPG